MWVPVRCYCCINYSSAIFTSLRISVLSLRILHSSWCRHVLYVHSMVNTRWVITGSKATWASACRLQPTNYSPGHCRVSRPTELLAVPLSRLCYGLWLRLNRNEEAGRVEGLFSLCPADRPLDSSADRQRTSALQPLFRSGSRSLPGPWENKGVRLHLFSISVPRGIKGEDIPAVPPDWVRLT